MDVNKRMEKRTLAANDEFRAVQEALASLRPPSRATLDLIYRQRLPPAEVARISGVEEVSVEEWRAAALEELAEALNVSGPKAAASMLNRAVDSPPGDDEGTAPSRPSRPAAGASEGSHRPVGQKRESPRLVPVAIVAVMLAVTIAAIAIVLSGGEDGEADPAPSASAPAEPSSTDETPEPEPASAGSELSSLPGAPGSGSVVVTPTEPGTQTIELDISGMPQPDGRYEAWLYTSILDSVSLGSIDSGDGTITVALPPDARDYEFLDVSIQDDRDGPHSGRSIFRAPAETLFGER